MRNEKIGAKIRQAQLEKIPLMLVVGDREAADGTVAVRLRARGDQGATTLDAFAERAGEWAEGRSLSSPWDASGPVKEQ